MTCACGLGGAIPRRFPTVEKVLAKWIADQIRAGNYYYISPELNSDVQAAQGVTPEMITGMYPNNAGLGQFEFLPAIFAAIGSVATTVGTTVAAVAPSVASIVGTVASIKTINAANNRLAQQTPAVVVPTSAATQTVQAVQQDLLSQLGITPTMAMLGIGGLVAILLLTGRKGRR